MTVFNVLYPAVFKALAPAIAATPAAEGYQFQDQPQFRPPFIDRSSRSSFEQPPGTLSYVTGYQYQSPTAFRLPVPQQWASGFVQPPGTLSYVTGYQFQDQPQRKPTFPVANQWYAGWVQPSGTLSYVTGYQFQDQPQFKPTFLSRTIDGWVQPPGTLSFQVGFQFQQPFQLAIRFLARTIDGFIFTPTTTATPSTWGMFSQSEVQYLKPFIDRSFENSFEQPPGTLSFQVGFQFQQPIQLAARFLTRTIDGFVPTPTTGTATPSALSFTDNSVVVCNVDVVYQSVFGSPSQSNTATPSSWGMFSPSPVRYTLPFINTGTLAGFEVPTTPQQVLGFSAVGCTLAEYRIVLAQSSNVPPPTAVATPSNWGMFSTSPVQYKLPFIDRSFENSFEQPPGTLSFQVGFQFQQPLQLAVRFLTRTIDGFIFTPTGTATPSNWGMFSQSEIKILPPGFPRAFDAFVF